MKRMIQLVITGLYLMGFAFIVPDVRAFSVLPLPSDNLIQNPWFRSAARPSKAGFDFWTHDPYWVTQQKDNQPSPDSVVGTAVKIGPAKYNGTGVPGVNGYIYQVVSAPQAHDTLHFQTWWIGVYHEEFTVTVYGSINVDGPWANIWVPLSETDSTMAFIQSPLYTVSPAVTYPYYKVEMIGRFTEGLGIKFTGVYFAVSQGSPNLAPRAVFSAEPQAGIAPLAVRFDASESMDADGTILTYSWDFGDGTSSQEVIVDKTYDHPGNYYATLSVTDDMGAYGLASVNIAVGPFPPQAAFSVNPAEGFAPLTVHVDGSASSDVDGTITGYEWDFGDGVTASGVTNEHTYNDAGNYQITLTVTDDGGSQSTTTHTVNVLPVGSNLLTDGGFENGGQSWANIGSSGVKVVSSTFHSGSKSIEITAPASGSKIAHQTVVADGGQVYDISGFVKTEGITNVVQISAQWQTSSGSLISTSNIGSTMQGTNEWTLRSKRLTAPSTAGKFRSG